MTNINFSNLVSSGNDLKFGIDGGTAVVPLYVDAVVDVVMNADTDITLPTVSVDAEMFFDISVWRGPQNSTAMLHEDAESRDAEMEAMWPAYCRLRAEDAAPWQQAQRVESSVAGSFADLLRIPASSAILYDDARRLGRSLGSTYSYPDKRRVEAAVPWATGDAIREGVKFPYIYPGRKQQTLDSEWRDAASANKALLFVFNPSPARRKKEWGLPWGDALGVVSLWPRPDPWVPEEPEPYVPTPDLNFCFEVDGTYILPLGRKCGDQIDPPLSIPVLRTYIVIHDISLTRLEDGYEIDAERLSVGANADAWTWQFSATLRGKEALDAVVPDSQGQPVTLVAAIDGHTWYLVVEDWTEDREFGKRSVAVTGRGLPAELAQPYLLADSGVTSSDMTVQQLMAAHLPLGSGWSLSFAAGTPDWLVPAGAWSWSSQTPIAAIHAAAQEMGLVVVPGMADRSLTIQPRYPVLPWDYDTSAPDLIVPESAILKLQRRQAVATQANAVYVHGGEVGGVLARVIRNLSAGDRVAATQSSSLITHVDAARLLGGRILSGQHQQPTIKSVTIPLGGVFPLAAMGNLMHVDLADSQRGVINAVNVEVNVDARSGKTTVRQSLYIGEDTPSVWAKFKHLLPSSPLLVGVVSTSHGDGTATVELVSGGYVRVRGDAAAGSSVYVRQGRIEGNAPSLSQLDITV